MKGNYKQFLKHTLLVEGGYVNDPDDAGGETNCGITIRTYEYYYKEILKQDMPNHGLKEITDKEVSDIYKALYWDKVRGDDLPSGVDLMVADYAVNSGVSRSAKALQSILNVEQDGIIGSQTIAKTSQLDAHFILHKLYMLRRQYFFTISSIRNNIKFLKGWLNRLNTTYDDAFDLL
jgi:lysozyme family protein